MARSRRRGRTRRTATTLPPQPEPTASTSPPPPFATSDSIAADEAGRSWWEVGSREFVLLGALVLALAAGLRLWDLGLVPFHHDEGINGNFTRILLREGTWNYNPANYHGPTLFYLAFASAIFVGLTDEALRLVPALFGIGAVGLILAMRPFVGSMPALAGAALLAVSPGAVYYSRYFIHESLLATLTLAVVLAWLWYVHRRREIYLLVGAASLALLLATKETGIGSVLVIATALVVGTVYLRLRARDKPRAAESLWWTRRQALAQLLPAERLITAVTVFLVVYVVFFSSFGSNPRGLLDSLATFEIWTQTGAVTQVHPPIAYLDWMVRGDTVLLVLGLIGGLIAAWRGTDSLAVFVGLWALGLTVGYSLITYKVPWILLNMLVPLAILGGLAVTEMLVFVSRRTVVRLRLFAAVGLAGCLVLSLYQTVQLNFVQYDDDAHPYVYVHTTRETFALIDETRRIAAQAGGDGRPAIAVMSPEYWPLPWYYRDDPQVLFWGTVVATQEPMILARADQAEQLADVLDGAYREQGSYTLRPGVTLVLYVRDDLPGR